MDDIFMELMRHYAECIRTSNYKLPQITKLIIGIVFLGYPVNNQLILGKQLKTK